MMKIKLLAFLLLTILTACQAGQNQVDSLKEQSRIDMANFYHYLNQGKFNDAAFLYAGSYEVLEGYNPEIDPKDHSSLLEAACNINGFMCLELYSAEFVEQPSEKEFVWNVSFRLLDGSQLEVGPCCGADEEDMPPVSHFEIHVKCDLGSTCKVLDLPPYIP